MRYNEMTLRKYVNIIEFNRAVIDRDVQYINYKSRRALFYNMSRNNIMPLSILEVLSIFKRCLYVVKRL